MHVLKIYFEKTHAKNEIKCGEKMENEGWKEKVF